MQFAITFRHMEPSEAIRQHALDKLQRVKKFFPDPIRAQIVFSIERYRYQADINITLHNGFLIQGKESTDDMYSSIDLVMDKIERQLRRYKDKINSHRAYSTLDEFIFEDPQSGMVNEQKTPAAAPSPNIIQEERKYFPHPLSPDEAIIQMKISGEPFLVFTNAVSREVNVVYLRPDGKFGLIRKNSPQP